MKRLSAVALALAVAIGQPIEAQPFPPDVLPQELSSSESLRFTGTIGSYSSTAGAVVGPYNGIMTSMPGQPAITLYCVDFLHGISTNSRTPGNTVAEGIDMNVWALDGAPGTYSTTRHGAAGISEANGFFNYSRAAFLASLFSVNPQSSWGGIHAAIWTIMSPGYSNASRAALAAPWLTIVNDAFADPTFDFDTSGWAVMTDVRVAANPNGNIAAQPGYQEYLVRTTVTPEPETYVLMGSGLLLLAFFGRRRFQEFHER